MKPARLSLLIVSLMLKFAVAAQAAAISGTVVDPDGRTVAGARVIAAAPAGAAVEGLTDSSGRFDITALAAGVYEVRVVAEGFQTDPVSIALAADGTRELFLRLRLSAVTESIVVSAAQVDVLRSRTADAVDVVTAGELQARQLETVADALRLVPGLALTRSGGRGAITSLFPRGGNSNYTLVMIDGIRANAFGGGYDFAHLPVSDVERVEIVRGPQSALFGSDAIGAVVQVVTRRGGRPELSGLVEAGGQSTTRTAFHASGSRGRWIWGAGAEHTKSNGFTGLSQATGERVSNDDDHLSHFSGSLGYDDPSRVNLLVAANIGRDERGFPGPFGSNPIGAYTAIDRLSRGVDDVRQIGGRVGHRWSQRVRQRIDANYTDLSGDFTSAFGPSSSGTRRSSARVQEDVDLGASWGASAGVELQRERATSTFIQGAAGRELPIRRGVTGAFGELRYAPADRLRIVAGTRLEHIRRDAVDADPSGFPARPAFQEQVVTSVNPKVALSYMLARGDGSPGSKTTRLRLSAGTGIRPPDGFEIAFTNNPNLKPERSRSVDAGIDQQFAGGKYAISATTFANRYDDLIVAVGKSLRDASQYQTDNIANARAAGLELSGNVRVARTLTFRAVYGLVATEVLAVDTLAGVAPPPFTVGDPLIRRPRHQGGLVLTYASGRVTAFGELTMRSQVLDVEPSYGAFGGLFPSPGYTVVNGGASIRIARRIEVHARILNVADRAYEEALGYPALRRQAIVGARIAAGR